MNFEKAERIIDEYLCGGCNNIIYLTDYDTIINQNKLYDFRAFKLKYSAFPEVLICETMPSIEFWFLIHYEYTTSEFRNSGEVERRLRTYISDYSKSKSFLESRRWVENLMADNRPYRKDSNSHRTSESRGGRGHGGNGGVHGDDVPQRRGRLLPPVVERGAQPGGGFLIVVLEEGGELAPPGRALQQQRLAGVDAAEPGHQGQGDHVCARAHGRCDTKDVSF